ncbi:MAG: DUF3618 domain-containing protein [Candidatus Eremiobacteraeota bacterium]|nr:DUF3618 domain-containing protein [Candidatus Eremiobacteraeota bacterium]
MNQSQDPDAIRQEIDETRSRMGETVEALAYKTDVPARARDAVNERVEAIKGRVSDVIGSATGALGGAASSAKSTAQNAAAALPTGEDAAEQLRAARSYAAQNPLGVAIGAIAVGFLVGLCLPVSEIERKNVGRLGEQMTEQAKTAAAGAIEQGKAAVTQAIGDALTGAQAPPQGRA